MVKVTPIGDVDGNDKIEIITGALSLAAHEMLRN
jgi:hypothetical protein